MKSLPFLLLSTATLLGQQPQSEQRVPREPSRGDVQKTTPAPEAPTAPATTLQVPTEQTSAIKPVSPALMQAIAAATAVDEVRFDRPTADGALWALGSDYKASFMGDRWSYIARPTAAADHLQPLTFHLASARVAGKELSLAAGGEATLDGNRVHLQHGSVRETLELEPKRIEQTFTFANLPQRGELVLAIDLATELVGQQDGAGLRFVSDWLDVRYTGAIAIDADGDRIAADTRLVDGHVEIRVPAEFVAAASMPLVIDPVVSGGTVTTGTADVGNPDVVYVPTTGEWIATYQQSYAAGDWDCWVQRMDANMQPTGTRIAIDYTSNNFYRPRIAHLRYYGQSLVVGEVRNSGGTAKVVGRIVDNALGFTTAQFDVATSSVDETVPDVGADSYNGSGYFTVVWEHAYSGTDHDVYARQVTSAGTLRGTSPTFVDTSTYYEANPTISKSDGGPSGANQLYAVAYQRQKTNLDQDIRGALLSWDGVLQLVNGANNFPIDSSSASYSTRPHVSSPSLLDNGNRVFLCVYENAWSNAGDIEMSAFDQNGTVLANGNVVQAEGSLLRLGWPQSFASVDCDGTRFAVAYHENWNNSTTDLDARVTTVSYGSGQLFAMDSAALAATGAPEFAVQIASRYSSSASQDQGFATVNDKDSSGTYLIEGDRYDANPTGLALVRSTSCGGGVYMTETGDPLPGNSLAFQLTNTAPIAGFSLGGYNSASLPGCPCIVGTSSFLNTVGTYLPINIPANRDIIGATLSVQGWMLGAPGTSCLFDIHLSDTIDITVR